MKNVKSLILMAVALGISTSASANSDVCDLSKAEKVVYACDHPGTTSYQDLQAFAEFFKRNHKYEDAAICPTGDRGVVYVVKIFKGGRLYQVDTFHME